jgi:hypothetical protein
MGTKLTKIVLSLGLMGLLLPTAGCKYKPGGRYGGSYGGSYTDVSVGLDWIPSFGFYDTYEYYEEDTYVVEEDYYYEDDLYYEDDFYYDGLYGDDYYGDDYYWDDWKKKRPGRRK